MPEALAPEFQAIGFASLKEDVAGNWGLFEGHVFVAAAGIVVRTIAPLLAAKDRDPAVVVVGQDGRHAVSLLSGHVGGANALARRVAAATGGQAVITTATDIEGLPALDVLAASRGLAIDNLTAVKAVSAALLDGRPVTLFDPENRLGLSAEETALFRRVDRLEELPEASDDGPAVAVTWRVQPGGSCGPSTLFLRPRSLAAGIGCRRGTPAEEILSFVRSAMAKAGLSPLSLAAVGTIEAKRDEEGLLLAARELGADMAFFTAEELNGVQVPSPPGPALKHMGVASVCEAAAILLSRNRELLLPKVKTGTATLAVSLL